MFGWTIGHQIGIFLIKKDKQSTPYCVYIIIYNYKPNKVGIYKLMYIKALRLGTHFHEGFQCKVLTISITFQNGTTIL